MNSLALRVTPEQANNAKRLMAVASLENLRLIHVRAAHMIPDCPVKTVEEKELPTTRADLMPDVNRFRVVFGHAMRGSRGAEGGTQVQVDATFELIYSFPSDLDPAPSAEELRAFAETNAVMNCWPYWRELVQGMVAKMNLPPLVVPLLRYSPQQKTQGQTHEGSEGSKTLSPNLLRPEG